MAQEKREKADTVAAVGVEKKRPPKEVIDKMNRIIIAAAEAGKTPAELEDEVYRKMFGDDE